MLDGTDTKKILNKETKTTFHDKNGVYGNFDLYHFTQEVILFTAPL